MYPDTALEMYELTLEIINKSNTTSITPDEWNIWANTVQLEHVLSLYGKYQGDQAVMDRLNPLIVDPSAILNTGANVSEQEIFELPSDYLRLLNVKFRLHYINDECNSDGPGLKFVPASLVSDDEDTIVDENPYRKPKANRLLYKHAAINLGQNNVLKLRTGGQSYGIEAMIRYLRYPRKIDVTQSPGIGDCELPIDTRNDICHIIARRVIEAIENGRYPQIAGETNQVINN